MTVLREDTLVTVDCLTCRVPLTLVTERDDDGLRVTVLDGCDACAGCSTHIG